MQEADVPKLAELLQGHWREHLDREGLPPVTGRVTGQDSDEPPCPACGTAAALVDGACSDCGLQLE